MGWGGFQARTRLSGILSIGKIWVRKLVTLNRALVSEKVFLFSFTVITTECAVSQIDKSRMYCIWWKCSAGVLYFKIYVRTLWDIYRGYAQYNQVFARKRNARFRGIAFNSQYTLARKFTQTQIHTQRKGASHIGVIIWLIAKGGCSGRTFVNYMKTKKIKPM